jgi:hypothetical protein
VVLHVPEAVLEVSEVVFQVPEVILQVPKGGSASLQGVFTGS